MRPIELLDRPDEQRLREYKYRFSQSVVFGLPVIALGWYGPRLGPADRQRWVSLLQALLAGWVLYVNIGMLFEGMMLLIGRRQLSGDLAVTFIAIVLYAISLISAGHAVVTNHLWLSPLLFSMMVVVLCVWTGVRWLKFVRSCRKTD